MLSAIVPLYITILLFSVEIQNMINTTPNPEQQELQKTILLSRHKEELKQTDMKLVIQLDQKVCMIL